MIGLVVGAIAIAAWFKAAPTAEQHGGKTYSAEDVTHAKMAVCDAFGTIHDAVLINTARNGGSNPAAVMAIAANARLAMYAGGGYMIDALIRNPATPAELATPVRKLAELYRYVAIQYLINKTNADLKDPLREADSATLAIQTACK
ncbi:hypothetical protein CRM90_20515 [Mycobacterium sp. ENV421]|uniref:hypothetical protein n=1 Tax=Mycobacterium sp. ENV421 TaxID=1213407 RepID=UPI000C9B6426|nr:hypothetical protein [Mycobacterium sp. ENV421]PND55848.1 hypothetical protein CRM90_20515 [Mycobacterium sp. ENV421]